MKIKIALAGNPNSGKTTLFNALTGSNQFVGNWPGVTVEKKEGRLKNNSDVVVTDLPGIYSLSPYTPEEIVARDYLLKQSPDVIIDIVDGTNLERNLYLTTQLLEVGIPIVIAVNMIDVVRKNGDEINTDKLSSLLGCKVLEISALKEIGITETSEEAIKVAESKMSTNYRHFSQIPETAIANIEKAITSDVPENKKRWCAIKLFERDKKTISYLNLTKSQSNRIESEIKKAEILLDNDSESIIANERYNVVEKLMLSCLKKGKKGTLSDKIDSVVTNRYMALPIFALIMFSVYFISVSMVGMRTTDFMNGVFGDGFSLLERRFIGIPEFFGNFLDSIGCATIVKSLIIDGIIGGVGSVLSFVPQMLMLFFFLAFLEACGYMSRIAFMMDRVFRRFGLSGKSFIPLLIGTGCSVPGIMASRTIENDSERRMTVITTSFIPCGAKIPLIAMISSSLFSGEAWIAPSAYLIGIISVVVSGAMLKKISLFESERSPFIMELPEYRIPTLKNLLRSTWERGSAFIKKAGTVILLASVVVWAGSHFGYIDGHFGFFTGLEPELSIIGTTGRAIAWIFTPLGFGNAKAVIATIMGLLAKEEIVGVFGVLDFEGLNKLSGYSFMVFNLLCAPCVAAMGAIKREMASAKWTIFALCYQTVFAYGVSLCIYQLGLVFTGEASTIGIISAFAVIATVGYMLTKDDTQPKKAGHIAVIRFREKEKTGKI